MTSVDRMARVRTLIAGEAETLGDRSALAGWLQRVCRTAARDLPAMGVGISLLTQGNAPLAIATSSEALVPVEELQFVLGEGPCLDACTSRHPVLVPDLSKTAATTWTGYAPAAHALGVRAVFAFPLQVGAAHLGAMDVYRDRPGVLTLGTLSTALTFAEVAMQRLLLDAGAGTRSAADLFDDIDGNRFEVYQAQGMLMAQLDISDEEALSRLRAYTFAHGQRAVDVAREVIERKLTLESDT